jgi:hypothetical protein
VDRPAPSGPLGQRSPPDCGLRFGPASPARVASTGPDVAWAAGRACPPPGSPVFAGRAGEAGEPAERPPAMTAAPDTATPRLTEGEEIGQCFPTGPDRVAM